MSIVLSFAFVLQVKSDNLSSALGVQLTFILLISALVVVAYLFDKKLKGFFYKWESTSQSNTPSINDEHLRQLEKMAELHEIFSSTPSCLKVVDKEGKLLDMNPQGLSLIEAKSMNEVFGANVFDLVEESHREKFIDFHNKVCQGHRGTLRFEIIGLNGTRRWMETYAGPYKLSNGETAHIAITNDVTSKIQDEANLEKQKIIALHQSKLASIGELAAGVGHEINNPLAIIKGYLCMIDENLNSGAELDLDELKLHLEKIDLSTDRIAKIVQGLRKMSRTDSLDFADFNVCDVISDCLAVMTDIYLREGIHLSYVDNLSHLKLKVYGSSGKFQQVLMNLISNTKDALTERDDKTITLKTSQTNDYFLITVSDNGIGIPSSIKDRIFDPFFTTKDVNKGTGIGLSLVHNFIKDMDG